MLGVFYTEHCLVKWPAEKELSIWNGKILEFEMLASYHPTLPYQTNVLITDNINSPKILHLPINVTGSNKIKSLDKGCPV